MKKIRVGDLLGLDALKLWDRAIFYFINSFSPSPSIIKMRIPF
jgi:hypothetical protein